MQKTAINPTRTENFTKWYQKVIKAADLAEYTQTRGCMVIKPYGYAIWENIQNLLNSIFKKLNIENVYFPLLMPIEFLDKEYKYINEFTKECAVVTHYKLKLNKDGKLTPNKKLKSPYIIRPSSEAIIGNIISNWIHSYKDLPIKFNQWCNAIRWEMRTRLFLRTSEFLWQEGHTIFEDNKSAIEDAKKMHFEYFKFITKYLAMSAFMGEKPKEEKFPGAKNTYTIELMMQDGKALQAATSHNLEQSFSKAFNIVFLNRNQKKSFVYTTSWGISTRLIGAIIMSHSDDNGLVLPPKIAPYQVVIIPIVIKKMIEYTEIISYCKKIKKILISLNIRTFLDESNTISSKKKWKWIKRGAPIIFEIGSNEAKLKNVTFFRRDNINIKKKSILLKNIIKTINNELFLLEKNLRIRMYKYTKNHTKFVNNLKEMEKLLENNFYGFIIIEKDFTENINFLNLAKKYSISRRCILNDSSLYSKNKCVIVAKSY